jgi:hypothetical protein
MCNSYLNVVAKEASESPFGYLDKHFVITQADYKF